MANGRAVGRLEAALGVVGLLALATTYALITGWNPGPAVLDWLDRVGSLSQPAPAWAVRTGARPEYAVLAGRSVVVMLPGAVEVRDASNGDKRWSRDVNWAAVAGDPDAGNAVVVTGRPTGRGFDVTNPDTGAPVWNDADAVGVWTYREVLLALACKGLSECTLTAFEPGSGAPRWRTDLPGVGRTLAGLNHDLLGSEDLTSSTVDGRVALPAFAPPMLGFPVDGRIQVVDLGSGRRLHEARASGDTRVVVVAGRVLHSTAQRQGAQCRYRLVARDPANDTAVWNRDGYDLRTASGAGCEQRRDPAGSGGTLAAVRGDNRETLLDAYDGRELWVGRTGERVLATDGLIAVVRAADGRSVRATDLGGGVDLWTREVSTRTGATLTRHAVVLVDPEPGRVTALDPATGRLLVSATTSGKVIGVGRVGVVVAAGRNVGLLTYGTGS